MSRPPLFYHVPAQTEPAKCKYCPALIYWVLTPKKKHMPVDCHAGEGCLPPTSERPGSGIAHWGTCPNAAQARKPSTNATT